MMTETLPAVSKHVDRAAILAYAAITEDFNPLHVDEAFAAGTPFGKPIAHGMLSLNLVWQSLRRAFGEAMPISLEIRFVRPVLVDTEVTSGGRRREDGAYDVWVRDASGQDVILGTAWLGAGAVKPEEPA
ncbi:MaoC family dehydratase [Sabulicella rubraurantiaca]|uniref:MaoC family dehydratase n=1 Tax=Sabulicella rubraurantiaca TaxID=2811429 RepID=UPI001A959BF8|nr:MaoC family dehydratase [Sabulicella rubraurantiaca]